MIAVTIPVALMEQANAELESLGFGPANFSVAMKASGESASHAGLNCWEHPQFRAAIEAMLPRYPGMAVGSSFTELATGQALEWSDPTNWTVNPVMKGDQRTFDNKLWESLLDYNVWQPPVGWREVVQEGYPAWVQPTGAHDAYKIGDKVSFQGKRYISVINANIWSPLAYPQGWAEQP